MATDNSQNEVLHSENHTKLTAEQIAKAVARHKRDHSATPKDRTAVDTAKAPSQKAKKPAKG